MLGALTIPPADGPRGLNLQEESTMNVLTHLRRLRRPLLALALVAAAAYTNARPAAAAEVAATSWSAQTSAVALEAAPAHAYGVVAPLAPATPVYRTLDQAPDTDPGLSQVTDLVAALVRVLGVALTIVGITGGIQGLIGGLPDLKLGTKPDGTPKFVLKGGLIVSWLVGLPVTLVAISQGWGPDLSSYPSGEAAIAGLWAFYSSVSNIVRNAIVGSGGGGAEGVIRELAKRGLLKAA